MKEYVRAGVSERVKNFVGMHRAHAPQASRILRGDENMTFLKNFSKNIQKNISRLSISEKINHTIFEKRFLEKIFKKLF